MKMPTRSSGTRYHRDPLVDAIARWSALTRHLPRPGLEPLDRAGVRDLDVVRDPAGVAAGHRETHLPRGCPLVGGSGGGSQRGGRRSDQRDGDRDHDDRLGAADGAARHVAVRRGGAARAAAPVSARKGIASQFTPEPSSGPHDSTSEAAKSETASTTPAATHRTRAETRPRSNRSDSRPIATTARPVNTPKCQIHLLGANASSRSPIATEADGRRSSRSRFLLHATSAMADRDDEERDQLAARRRRSPLPEGS